jgi:hypothetical protein
MEMGSSWKNMVVAGVIMTIGVAGLMVKFKKLPPGASGALGKLGLSGGGKVEKEERPPTWADLLRLSGMSGSRTRRLAIINNKTVAVGETVRVEVEGEKIKIVCHEIREQSAVFQVEGAGEPFELFLRSDAGVSSNAAPAFAALTAKSRGTNVPAAVVQTNNVQSSALPVALNGEQLRALAARIPTNPIVELEAATAPAGPSGQERSPAVQ